MGSYQFASHPVANPQRIVVGEKYRFIVLSEGPIRYESSSDGNFEDRDDSLTLNDHPAEGLHEFEDEYKEMAAVLGHNTNARDPFHSAQMIQST